MGNTMLDVAKRIDPTFGTKLREIREAAGLTLVQLAEQVDMAWTSIARLERGEREPTWSTLVKLADALNASLDEFRGEDDDDNKPKRKPRGK